ncbi:MAG TPA: tyrosine-type recombinase/integrase [Actinomycetes bacterium]|nr:tyrosine-type recombinase/integrase [Actinomycetes bacterium]
MALDTATAILGSGIRLVSLSGRDIDRLVVALQECGSKPSTVSAVYRPLRTLLRWAVTQRYIDSAPTEGRRAPVIPETQRPIPTTDVVRAILATCRSNSRHDYLATRDAAIIRLFASTGARLAEVTNLSVRDVRLDEDHPNVTVMGKGRKAGRGDVRGHAHPPRQPAPQRGAEMAATR